MEVENVKKNFLKKVCVAAMAVVMTVGSAMSAMAAEYDAQLVYADGGYWPINIRNKGESDQFITPSSQCKVNGAGTYSFTVSFDEVEAEGFNTWGNASSGMAESEIIVYSAGTEYKDYKVSDLKFVYDGEAVTVDMSKISTYVYDKNGDGAEDFGIFIYNKWDESGWSPKNPPFDVSTVGFEDKLEVSFTLVAPEPESSSEPSSESESSNEAGGAGSGSGSGSGESGTPSTGDSSMVATFVALAAVSALVVLKKRTVNE